MSNEDSETNDELSDEFPEEDENINEDADQDESEDDEDKIEKKDDYSEEVVGENELSEISKEETTPEPNPENILTLEEAKGKLSLLGKTASGMEYAYLMLNISDMELTDINVIPFFKNVLFVNVSGNRLTNADIQVLTLNRNQITSTAGANHPLLECLELNYNKIKEISGLDPLDLPHLKVLELRGNGLISTSGIHLSTLESLYLAENSIDKLEHLEGLVNLRVLHLRQNPLSKLDGFCSAMKSMKYLNIRQCKLDNLREIKKLSCLVNLETLVVLDNPFMEDAEEEYRVEVLVYLPKLKRLDKSPVIPEELEEADEVREERKGQEEDNRENVDDEEDKDSNE
uniref:Leucine-rich repeat protein n=1 Tax=Timema poppense TaxID=170557 RepID=A0A7R9CQG3_TIMPO|nr:unnamed protein product [Timema poppensis]